ncbi:MAG: TonB-dependent receptor [Bryobacterales bacterium]|nr:TonB-dependent receptor [Bryobacterales bacterium]
MGHKPVLRIAAALFFLCLCAYGQGTDLGAIRGSVVDSTGGVIPGASVTILDQGTQISRKLETNAFGEYEAAGLKSGTYRLTIAAKGFNSLELDGVTLRGATTARVDGRLEVSRSAETIVVREEAPVVQTDNPTVGGTLNNQQVTELPRDSRDYSSFLYLNPNITQSGTNGFKFLGAQSYGASFALDGQRTNGGVFGGPTVSQPSLETIGELTVLSNTFTAEYAGIANVRISTKRGGSEYHGSLFHDNKNFALAAWDLRDKNGQAAFTPSPAQASYPTPRFNLNEFGGSFGGPVPKVKNTFFFLAFEKQYLRTPVYVRNTRLPHPSLLAGDFSKVADSIKPLVPAAVTLNAAEVAQNTLNGAGVRFVRIPSRLMNPITSKLVQSYFPQVSVDAPIVAGNGRLADFSTTMPGQSNRNLGTLRVDHDFNENDRMYVVYNAQSREFATSLVAAPFTPLGLTQNEQRADTVSVSETHLFGPTVINEVRGGFNRVPLLRRSNTVMRNFLQGIGFSEGDIQAYGDVIGQGALDTYGHPAVNIGSAFQGLSNGGRNTYRPQDQNLITFGNTLTWVKGRHTLKFGADWVRNAATDGFTSGRGNPRGLINYSGASTDPLARFLMGMPANTVSYVNQFRPPMDVHNWEQGYFGQDDFKITSRVTLNLGLRYEIVSPFTENNDLLVNFDPDFVGAGGKKGQYVVPSERTLKFVDPRFLAYGVTTADKLGLPRSLVRTDYGNIAPRVGLAWRVTDTTVLRGGYGLFYPTAAAQGIRDPLATNSFQVGLTKNSTADAPLSGWPTGSGAARSPVSGGVTSALSGITSGNWVPFGLKQPRVHQYNVTFERTLGWQTGLRLSYLGTRMQRLISGVDYNLIPPSDTPMATTIGDGVTPCTPDDFDCDYSAADLARLPYPGLGTYLTAFQNFGHGRSNAFQMEMNRRFSGGLTFNVSYTLLDQKSTSPDTGNSSLGGTAYNQFNPSADYGMDAFTSRHRLVTYGIFQTPYGRGAKFGADIPQWWDAIAGGWQISWQAFAKSGTGFTPFWICDNCDPITPGNLASGSVDATGGFYGTTFRPVVSGDANVKSGDRLWNPDAFALMPLGADLFTNPNLAVRNLLSGPGTLGLSMGVRKNFRFRERYRLEVGADMNNILNHPLLSPDNYDIGALGNFTLAVDPKTLKPVVQDVQRNPDFGRLITSYQQEGVDSRRTIRLRLRITF